jgi:hypothetical protein
MITKDLIFVANILLDCEEMSKDGMAPMLTHIREKCRDYKIPEMADDIIKIVSRCGPVYSIGSVDYDFSEEDVA